MLVPEAVWSQVDCGPVNRWLAARAADAAAGGVRFVSGEDAPVTVLAKSPRFDLRASDDALVVVLNPDARRRACLAANVVTTALSGFGRFDEVLGDNPKNPRLAIDPCGTIELEPGEMRTFEARRLPAIRLPTPNARRSAEAAIDRPRLAIEAVTPSVDGGRFPVKRIAGETVRVEADILIDGHEKLAAAAALSRRRRPRLARDRGWSRSRNDRYAASFPLQRVGRHEFTIEAWRDVFATYRNELDKKFAAGLDVSLELIEGRKLVERRARERDGVEAIGRRAGV